MRQSGILLHITSLPSPYGIGTMGAAAYAFVDFLAAAGQSCWQVLPLGPAGLGESPYSTVSAFGGNPLLLDLDLLVEEGLLLPAELPKKGGDNPSRTDFATVHRIWKPLLRQAFLRFRPGADYIEFCREASFWLEDYALWEALKEHFDGTPWPSWPEDIRRRDPAALSYWEKALARQKDFRKFLQYEFFRQWRALRAHANARGIQIIGDVSIYVPMDSADVWAMQKQFLLDENHRPLAVAGVPPDYFSEDGQLWGNPLYNWDTMEKDGFSWWVRRLSWAGEMFDVVRIDHFRGLESFWAVPFGAETAREGTWVLGPGRRFIDAVKTACGGTDFIAEDLGCLTENVHALRAYAGWPGMKVLQFAFDSGGCNPYLPHAYDANCVCYTGTHDNETLAQWWAELGEGPRRFAGEYLGLNDWEGALAGVIRAGMGSVAARFLCPMQDWLGLGPEGRMNTPGQPYGCWDWRMRPGDDSPALAEKIKAITVRYGR